MKKRVFLFVVLSFAPSILFAHNGIDHTMHHSDSPGVMGFLQNHYFHLALFIGASMYCVDMAIREKRREKAEMIEK